MRLLIIVIDVFIPIGSFLLLLAFLGPERPLSAGDWLQLAVLAAVSLGVQEAIRRLLGRRWPAWRRPKVRDD
jgi:hypothetical protein